MRSTQGTYHYRDAHCAGPFLEGAAFQQRPTRTKADQSRPLLIRIHSEGALFLRVARRASATQQQSWARSVSVESTPPNANRSTNSVLTSIYSTFVRLRVRKLTGFVMGWTERGRPFRQTASPRLRARSRTRSLTCRATGGEGGTRAGSTVPIQVAERASWTGSRLDVLGTGGIAGTLDDSVGLHEAQDARLHQVALDLSVATRFRSALSHPAAPPPYHVLSSRNVYLALVVSIFGFDVKSDFRGSPVILHIQRLASTDCPGSRPLWLRVNQFHSLRRPSVCVP